MADKTLRYVILGEDRSAGKTLKNVGTEAGKTGGLLGKLGGSIKGGLLAMAASVTVGAVTDIASEAIKANNDAEKSQRALEDAYKRFPAVASVSIDALRKYNQELQNKTGADADDLAASQAVLARYKLTGSQLRSITPLLVDYAARTGKDLPAAAGTLGKAMMGSGRAMKELGIKFKDTGDPAKNFSQIMGGLRKSVGGYAEKEAATAEGKTKILSTRFGDLQEAIGAKLQPVMEKLLDAGNKVLDWLDANPAALEAVGAGFDALVGIIEGVVNLLGPILQPILVGNIKMFSLVARTAAGLMDALSNVPGFGWAKGVADNLNKMANGADKAADGIADIGKQRVVVNTDKAKANVTNLQKKIDGIKGKIVKAEAKGDDKAVDRLKSKLAKLKSKYNVALNVYKTGISGIKSRVIGGGNISLRAYRVGGRPKVGELAMFHRDELWVPDQAGTVISQDKSRAMRGSGPLGIGGGVTLNVAVSGDTDPDAAARRIAAKLGKYFRNGGTINGGKVGR